MGRCRVKLVEGMEDEELLVRAARWRVMVVARTLRVGAESAEPEATGEMGEMLTARGGRREGKWKPAVNAR